MLVSRWRRVYSGRRSSGMEGLMVRVSRRSLLTVVVGTAAASLLTACGQQVTPPGQQAAAPQPQPTAASNTPAAIARKVSISVWTWTSVENLPAWNAAADGFRAKHPDIGLNLQHVPINQYWEKVTVGYAGDAFPDIVYLPPVRAQDLGTRGMLTDLTSLVKADNFDLGAINPVTQKPYMWGGKIFAINAMNDTSYIAYNATMYKEAGISEMPPQKWDADFSIDRFLEVAKELTVPAKQQWGFAQSQRAVQFVFLFGGRLWDDDDYPTRSALDTPESIAGLQFIQDLIYKHRVQPGPGDGAGIGDASGIGPTDDIFKTGKIGMVFGRHKHGTGIFKPITAFEWSMTTFPTVADKARRTDMGINGFGIINKSKNQDAAWQWIKWMTADDGNARLLGNTSLPANRNVDPYKVSPLPKWQTDMTLDGLSHAWLPSPHPNIRQQMIDALNSELDLLYLNKKSGAEVGKSAAEAINEIFEKLGPVVPR